MNEDTARRLEDALELADLAERMMRARLQREHPESNKAEVEARLVAWLQQGRGVLDGDADGRYVELGRRS